jgi:SnoaL-like domain
MTNNAPETLMTRSLLDVFNQRDPQQRAAAIDEIYSPDIVFYEKDDTFTGPAALHERVQQLLDGAPGFVFAPVGHPAINHDVGRQPWTFGPPDGSPVVFGTDIARMTGDRIQALYVFVEPQSS